MRLRSIGFVVLAIPQLAFGATAADFYAGKTIRMSVGAGPGGGYDIYARVIVAHMGGHVPGNPSIIVQNMPGAGGAKAATYIYNVAPKDGTAIGAIQPGSVIGPLLDDRTKFEYDPTKLIYLGTANVSTRVCVTLSQSKIKTFADAITNKTILGTAGEGDSTRDYAYMHKNTTRARFEIVSGYTATPDIMLAMERGEVDFVCGWDLSSLMAQKADYVRDNKINFLVQVGSPSPFLTAKGVPDISRFLTDETARQITALISAQQLFERPYILPPGTPGDRVSTLREAFAQTLADPAFRADAERAKIDIAPAGGERVQEGITTPQSSFLIDPRPSAPTESEPRGPHKPDQTLVPEKSRIRCAAGPRARHRLPLLYPDASSG
jgi:tripartite-type tricarboxylate transporter receptor subunit TctC